MRKFLCFAIFLSSANCFGGYNFLLGNFSTAATRLPRPFLATGPDPAKMADQICRTVIYEEEEDDAAGGVLSYETETVYFLGPDEHPPGNQPFAKADALLEIFDPESAVFARVTQKSSSIRVFKKLLCKSKKIDCENISPQYLPLQQQALVNEDYKKITSFFYSDDVKDRVEKNKKSPEEVLAEMYEKYRVVALGEANHHPQNQARKYFLEYIKANGHKEDFKYIAIEADANLSELFKEASVKGVSARLIQETVPSVHSYFGDSFPNKIVSKSEWLYFSLNTLVPLVREINLKRPHNPLLVVPIDGHNRAGSPIPKNNFIKNGVNLYDQNGTPVFSSSYEREALTCKAFESLVESLSPNEKVLVYYHFGHLIQGFKAKPPVLEDGIWKPIKFDVPSNWVSQYFEKIKDNKDAKLKKDDFVIGAFDERDRIWAPDGLLVPSKSLSVLAKGNAIALPMTIFDAEFQGLRFQEVSSAVRRRPFAVEPMEPVTKLGRMLDYLFVVKDYVSKEERDAMETWLKSLQNDCPSLLGKRQFEDINESSNLSRELTGEMQGKATPPKQKH